MKLFSMKERVKHLGSIDTEETREINTHNTTTNQTTNQRVVVGNCEFVLVVLGVV